MLRWIAATIVILTLLTGTSLMANAAQWTVIGDGYVPVVAVPEAEPLEVAAEARTPWLGVEDGYVLQRGASQVTPAPLPDTPPACCAEACPGADCKYMAGSHRSVSGDGYVPGPALQGPSAMTCC